MATRADVTKALTGTDLSTTRVLMVGAGGIGCELVKNLVLSGFKDITMIDLDTIDYSNLNRQFLFRAHHVQRSKALVAREAALEFPHDDGLAIAAHHGNIKDEQFGFDFFKGFDIVLNALDNVDARRHVNRVCLATGVPSVESGTQGYLGQVRAIVKGVTMCYECNPPQPPKSYPICTIRNHPDKPVHCIAWAKELLFKKLFGGEDTDLVDTSEEADEGGDGAGAAPAADAAAEAAPAAAAAPPLQRGEGEAAGAFARRVFSTVFCADVHRLLSMEALWKERAPPTPLEIEKLEMPEAASLHDVDRRAWSVAENAAAFVGSIERFYAERGDEVGAATFDKDDPIALDFVTSASNLRGEIFGIERQSRWSVKEIAGNIVPAIATTNAIIAGFIVLEALKVLGGRVNELKYVSLRRNPDVRPKGQAWLQATSVDEPNPNCPVCGDSGITLTVDCATFTVGMLLDRVVKKHLSFNKPTIDYTTMADDGDQLCEGTDDVDDDDKAKFERYLTKPFGELPVPIGAGTTLEIEDVTQGLNVKMKVVHAVLDDEEVPLGFTLSGEHDPAAHAAAHTAAGAAAAGGDDASDAAPPPASAGGKRVRAAVDGGDGAADDGAAAEEAAAPKRKKVESVEVGDGSKESAFVLD